MIVVKKKLFVRVKNCPVKKNVLKDRFFEIVVPCEDKVVKREATFEGEQFYTSLYFRLYERKVWTKQVFKSGKQDGCLDTDSQIFFQRLKRATLDGDIEQVELMTNALQKGVAKPQFSTRFLLTYALQASLIGNMYGEWEWKLDYDASCTTTTKDANILLPAKEIDECELREEEIMVNVGQASLMETPVEFVDKTQKDKKLKEIQRLIERQKQLRFEMTEIKEAASTLKGEM